MRPGRFERLARFGAGALMVLMVHGVCAPTAARADCSHRAGLPSAAISSLYGLDELIVTGNSSVSEDGWALSLHDWPVPRPRVPCSGLSCSSRVPLPVSTASTGHDRSDQWGTLEVPVVCDESSPPTGSFDGPAPWSVGQNSFIFHPPRV
jgi:hypothetical protein